MASGLALPVFVVAADRLGTLNHTLLTIKAVRMRELTLAGLISNKPALQTDYMMDNAVELERWLQIPLPQVPHISGVPLDVWRREAASLTPLTNVWCADIQSGKVCR